MIFCEILVIITFFFIHYYMCITYFTDDSSLHWRKYFNLRIQLFYNLNILFYTFSQFTLEILFL